ncbi:hypothetical protein ACWDRR_38930 [Kitasatospora sp. NPDC003701]
MLDDPRAPHLCVVSGARGIGKSYLLVWLAASLGGSDSPVGRRPDAAFSLAGMTADAAIWRLAARLGVCARTASELVLALRESDRPRLLLLWDLDRSAEPAAIAARVLDRLTDVPGLRVVAEGAEGIWEASPGAAVMALDEPGWTDPARFSAWYEKRRGASPLEAADVYPSPGLALLAATIPAEAPRSTGVGVHAVWWAAAGDAARGALAALAGAQQPLFRVQGRLSRVHLLRRRGPGQA